MEIVYIYVLEAIFNIAFEVIFTGGGGTVVKRLSDHDLGIASVLADHGLRIS